MRRLFSYRPDPVPTPELKEVSLGVISGLALHGAEVEERVVWSQADNCYVWISKLMGKDEREWDRLSFDVTAGISDEHPSIYQKGDRIRVLFVYDMNGAIEIGNIIAAATDKSVYTEPKSQCYQINSVTGMDAEQRARLIIASPGPFVVNLVAGKFRVTPEVSARYRQEKDDYGNPRGSMPDPELHGTTFYRRPSPPPFAGIISKRAILQQLSAEHALQGGSPSKELLAEVGNGEEA